MQTKCLTKEYNAIVGWVCVPVRKTSFLCIADNCEWIESSYWTEEDFCFHRKLHNFIRSDCEMMWILIFVTQFYAKDSCINNIRAIATETKFEICIIERKMQSKWFGWSFFLFIRNIFSLLLKDISINLLHEFKFIETGSKFSSFHPHNIQLTKIHFPFQISKWIIDINFTVSFVIIYYQSWKREVSFACSM